jgi:UDP-glucose 4-epimerase
MIVVTGGSGHLGQWVIAALTARGGDVVNLSRRPVARPTIPRIVWQRSVSTIACDLTDPAAVVAALTEVSDATALVHLAGLIPADTARNAANDADDLLRTNVAGTVNLLAALRVLSGLAVLIDASTYEVYGDVAVPFSEDGPTRPSNYYGVSKLIGERYVELAGRSGGWTPVILRLSTLYGPGDTLRRAVGNFVRDAAAGKPIEVHGDGSVRRDLVYVADVADAVADAAAAPGGGGVFNIGGGGTGTTIRELAQTVAAEAGVDVLFLPSGKPTTDVVLDTDRAAAELGWRPRTTLEEGVRAQLEWARTLR